MPAAGTSLHIGIVGTRLLAVVPPPLLRRLGRPSRGRSIGALYVHCRRRRDDNRWRVVVRRRVPERCAENESEAEMAAVVPAMMPAVVSAFRKRLAAHAPTRKH